LYGISRQAIYQSEKRSLDRQKVLEPVEAMVLDVRRRLPRVGTRKLYYLLKPEFEHSGIKLGRDGLFDYLRQRHLLIRPKRSYTRTTNSRHWLKKHPNLYQDMEVEQPEQAFVSDITYVESDEGIHYLSLVTDACSRRIMGHALSWDLKSGGPIQALDQAIRSRDNSGELIHHSDRGVQYCSSSYQQILRANGIVPSMTDGYDCYQNALAERVNGILKQEFLISRYKSFDELSQVISESVDTYNRLRPHLSLGMQTPEAVHKKARCQRQRAL